MLAHGIHPIARIVVAKDPLLASHKPAWAVQIAGGGVWRDRLDFAWVDAFNDSVWVYASQLAAEAVQMGFAEVQFDYVRFPDEPRARMANAMFPARRAGETTRHGVRRNLKLLRDRIKPLGVPFTIDVFGMTTNVEVDMGIGQVWEDLVSTADVVLPMVYPSHYYNSMYGVRRPNTEPYRDREERTRGRDTAESESRWAHRGDPALPAGVHAGPAPLHARPRAGRRSGRRMTPGLTRGCCGTRGQPTTRESSKRPTESRLCARSARSSPRAPLRLSPKDTEADQPPPTTAGLSQPVM